MKGKVLVITSSNKTTAYVPLSRLLRIEAIPAAASGATSTVAIIFEGPLHVNLQTREGEETNVAQKLYERLVPADEIDFTYIRPDSEKDVDNIYFGHI
jgi:hypothetical protein